jgi:hypothetical protein
MADNRMMKNKSVGLLPACLIMILTMGAASAETRSDSPLLPLLPEVPGWKLSEKPRHFFPESLFEYIDGAAEIYLSYDFKELVVAEYRKAGSAASLTLEIYDMGEDRRAFGIFSAERFPENRSVPVGNLGYIEGEVLNFISGRNYIKLLCFDGGKETEFSLTQFAKGIDARVKEKGSLPLLLQYFPRENIVAKSEKFILKNVMGYEFLHDGYLASYRQEGRDFECFLIEAAGVPDADRMVEQLLSFLAKDKLAVEKSSQGYHWRNRYGQHTYLGRVKHILCGVSRIPDGLEETGSRYLQMLVLALEKSGSSR